MIDVHMLGILAYTPYYGPRRIMTEFVGPKRKGAFWIIRQSPLASIGFMRRKRGLWMNNYGDGLPAFELSLAVSKYSVYPFLFGYKTCRGAGEGRRSLMDSIQS